MPYNENIDRRLTAIVSRWQGTTAKKMFGSVCHLIYGNMFCGVYKDFLILRLGEKFAQKVLTLEHARPFDITGRPMKGWIMLS